MQQTFRPTVTHLFSFPFLLTISALIAFDACSSGTSVDRAHATQQATSQRASGNRAYTVDGTNGIRYGISFLSQSESKLKFAVEMSNISVMPVTIAPTDFLSYYSKDTGSANPRFPGRSMAHAMNSTVEKSTIDSILTLETTSSAMAENVPKGVDANREHEESLQILKLLASDWDDALLTVTIPPGGSAHGVVVFFPRREWPLVMIVPPHIDSTQKLIFRVDGK